MAYEIDVRYLLNKENSFAKMLDWLVSNVGDYLNERIAPTHGSVHEYDVMGQGWRYEFRKFSYEMANGEIVTPAHDLSRFEMVCLQTVTIYYSKFVYIDDEDKAILFKLSM